MIEITDLTVRFGGVTPLDGDDRHVRLGHVRADRPQRRRQDDVLQRAQRLRAARPPARSHAFGDDLLGMAALPARALGPAAHVPDRAGDRGAVGLRQRRDGPRALEAGQRRRAARTCSARSSSSGSTSTRDVKVGTLGAARAAAGRGRARGRRQAADGAARRAGGRPARRGDRAPRPRDPQDPGAHRRAGDPRRPRHEPRVGVLRDHRGARLRQADRRRADGRGAARRAGRSRAYLGTEEDVRWRRRRSRRPAGRRARPSPRGGRPVVRDVSIEIPPARSRRCSAPTAPASRAWCSPSAACCSRTGGLDRARRARPRGRRPERIRQAGVAIVPEGRRLLPELTVEDNLEVATYALSRDEAQRRAAPHALELFPELEKRLDAPARSLSGGEQQMLVLAQALVSQPRFILIDELSLGLAPVIVKRLIPTIRDGRRVGHRRAADRAVRHGRARPRQPRLRDGAAGGIQLLRHAPASCASSPELLHTAYLLRGSNGVGAHAGGRRRRADTSGERLARWSTCSCSADDIERTREFYCEVVGLSSATGRRSSSRATGCTPATRRACTSRSAGPISRTREARAAVDRPAPDPGPVDHIAFSGHRLRRRRGRGWSARGVPAVLNAVPGGGPRQVFVQDPVGCGSR